MTALSDFITTLKGWTNREDAPDAVVTSWIRMGEERINNELLYKDMLVRSQALFVDNCSPLPPDWIKVQYVKYVRVAESPSLNIRRGRPFDFVSQDDYWMRTRGDFPYNSAPVYTVIGNDLFITGSDIETNNVNVEIGVYRKVPPLNDANWLYDNFIGLYTFASLAASAPWLMEDERMATWESKATQLIQLMNDTSKNSQSGGSPMKKKTRSFG